MEEIKAFLNDFLEAEVQAIKSRDIADLNDYNSKLDYMNSFVIDSVKNQFGMTPKHTLDSPQYYEKMKGAGNPDKRFVFRIDKFEQNERVIYKALVSERDPNGLMIYADCFIIEKRNSSKIIAKFFFSDSKWNFNAGDEAFMKIGKDRYGDNDYLLNKEALGKLVETERLLAPEDDEDSMREYLKDR